MRIKGVLISFLVLITFLGFLPIEKASASVSSDSVNEVGDRIDTSKNYYIVPADSPTRGLIFRLLHNSTLPVLVSSHGKTVEKPSADPMKLHFSEENNKYRIEYSMNFIERSISYWFQARGNGVGFNWEKDASYWDIIPVEGGYTIQSEGGYLYYKNVESSMNGPLTCAYLGQEKVVWKLVPAS
ncbi:hypothetical protein COM13_19305 [Bacillus pseudomycoides]|uniref:hypothetical protein n=1 Tax=Bacillus pseudomycoides TaxID=64104 RepID=UPI000BECA2F5|nr:hypothetical protein [Bacillus pseudomycoides]PDX97566.1 hypothetical protein COO07_26570 [Bacillus pseudomycoides]PEK80208.1 hypothetical protein CN597_10900 [Bacillus pseudomycoides]PEN11243.1 hypothetical protein CN640_04465 [Bacillus pseudomycoides]PGB86882.1 hypothetical protein COM13_19305 [Bacillus pseudomycoides]PHE55826.1 hypothetical protein COF52_13255 [Bacillus pseudomycoides]